MWKVFTRPTCASDIFIVVMPKNLKFKNLITKMQIPGFEKRDQSALRSIIKKRGMIQLETYSIGMFPLKKVVKSLLKLFLGLTLVLNVQ
jgi:hypothetical protein